MGGGIDKVSRTSSPSVASLDSDNDHKFSRRSPKSQTRSLKNLLDNLVEKQRQNDEEEQELIDRILD